MQAIYDKLVSNIKLNRKSSSVGQETKGLTFAIFIHRILKDLGQKNYIIKYRHYVKICLNVMVLII